MSQTSSCEVGESYIHSRNPICRTALQRILAGRGAPICRTGFLIQSDSSSRKWPFSTEFFWLFLSSVESILYHVVVFFVLFLEKGGWYERVLLRSRRNRLAALCFALTPRATARRIFVPASCCFRLSRKPSKLRSWKCTQARAAKATAGAAVIDSIGSRLRVACRHVIHAAGDRN